LPHRLKRSAERGDALEKEWSDREKRGLLLALFDYRQQTIPAAVARSPQTPQPKTPLPLLRRWMAT
jgi:hypothetical protein